MNSEDFQTGQTGPTPEPHREPHLTVLQAVGVVILLFVLQLIIARFFQFSRDSMLSENHWLTLSLTHLVSGLIAAKAGAILAGFTLIALILRPRFQFLLLLPLAVACCGITILASELGNVLHSIKPIPSEYIDFMNQLFAQNFWGVLFTIGIVAPLVEELVFRGVILEGLQIRYGARTGVIISSVLFGLTHIIPWAIVNAFLLGFFFSWLKLKTGSLRLCIIAHAFYNSIPLILSRFAQMQIPGFNTTPGDIAVFQPWWFDLMGVVLLLLGIGGMNALYEPEPPPLPVEPNS
ncbi:CPBP family intramembrane metalloprotease [bacterium]|nr:CPBP family intramembrane metalloprotease [bacterium]MCI0603998.1 CPBP family intramembrane metalloprotease [bacterium]